MYSPFAYLSLERLEDRNLLGFSNGLLGYWPFDADGNDLARGSRHFDLIGGVGFASGLFGKALDLHHNRSQYAVRPVDVRDDSFDFGSRDFTLQVWVNFNNTAGEQTLLEKFTGSSGPGWTVTKLPSQRWHFYSLPSGIITSSPQVITPGIWHHVVVRRSGSQFDLYYDGNLVGFASNPNPVPDTSAPLLVGKRNERDGRDFSVDGRLDEYAVWDHALSDAAIGGLYNGRAGQRLFRTLSDPPLGTSNHLHGILNVLVDAVMLLDSDREGVFTLLAQCNWSRDDPTRLVGPNGNDSGPRPFGIGSAYAVDRVAHSVPTAATASPPLLDALFAGDWSS